MAVKKKTVQELWLAKKKKTANINLKGKVVVFTGKLERMQRSDAEKLAQFLGFDTSSNVNAEVDYLVIGSDGFTNVEDNKSSKQKKAEELQKEGLPIQVIGEEDFFQILSDRSNDPWGFELLVDYFTAYGELFENLRDALKTVSFRDFKTGAIQECPAITLCLNNESFFEASDDFMAHCADMSSEICQRICSSGSVERFNTNMRLIALLVVKGFAVMRWVTCENEHSRLDLYFYPGEVRWEFFEDVVEGTLESTNFDILA